MKKIELTFSDEKSAICSFKIFIQEHMDKTFVKTVFEKFIIRENVKVDVKETEQ